MRVRLLAFMTKRLPNNEPQSEVIRTRAVTSERQQFRRAKTQENIDAVGSTEISFFCQWLYGGEKLRNFAAAKLPSKAS